MKFLNIFILIISTALLFSCSAVKMVLKDESKTQQVVDAYILMHPFKNDTTVRYLPGKLKTSVKYIPYADSIPYQVPCDSFTVKTPQGTTVSVDKYRKLKIINDSLQKEVTKEKTDTIQRDVVDRSLLIAAQDLARKQAAEISVKKETIKEQKAEIRKLNGRYWITISILGLLVTVYAFFRTKKIIKNNLTLIPL